MCIKVEDLKKFNEKQYTNYFEILKEKISSTNNNFVIFNGKVSVGKAKD